MAHPLYGSAQKGRTRFALYCVAVILRRFLCQGAEPGRKDTGCGKGDAACISHQTSNERTARMSFDRKRSRMSSSMP